MTPFLDHRFMRVSIVCHLPKRHGSPRHLHPCSATYQDRIEYLPVRQAACPTPIRTIVDSDL